MPKKKYFTEEEKIAARRKCSAASGRRARERDREGYRKKRREYQAKNRDKKSQQDRAYRARYPEKVKLQQERTSRLRKERMAAMSEEELVTHRAKCYAQSKASMAKKPEKYREMYRLAASKFREKNPEKVKMYAAITKLKADPEVSKARSKAYYYKNKKRLLARAKEAKKKWDEENPGVDAMYRRFLYLANHDAVLERRRKYQAANKERGNLQKKEWRDRNPQWAKDYVKRRTKEDVQFKLKRLYRTSLYCCIRAYKGKKTLPSLDYLGCTVEHLIGWLEGQWREGMSWDNHATNGWHIDHKIPCSSFDLTDPEQVKKCFHYTNLQPLWWFENLQKSDKLIYAA